MMNVGNFFKPFLLRMRNLGSEFILPRITHCQKCRKKINLWSSGTGAKLKEEDDAKVRKMFEQWMVKHEASYKDDIWEKEKRFKIFESDVRRVEKYNSNPKNRDKRAVNQYSDLTWDEYIDICGNRCKANRKRG